MSSESLAGERNDLSGLQLTTSGENLVGPAAQSGFELRSERREALGVGAEEVLVMGLDGS
jgi:hypothetical protein